MRLAALGLVLTIATARAEPETWKVEDLRPGMKGEGLTVIQGVAPERFQVELIGILRNVHPGRDMVIARFSGLGLEKSGVMAGMSGSPVTIDGKLVGAVAYTWEFGLEPIGGITPYSQMVSFAEHAQPSLNAVASNDDQRFRIDDSRFPSLGRLVPIQTPLAVSGMSSVAFQRLTEEMAPAGLIPVQSGAANPDIQAAHADRKLEPGSAMAVGLVLGDVQVSAVGTVTTVSEGRVYGFGHPFMELGRCEIPLLSAYIHTVMPLQSASFKIGSILGDAGMIDADVSTGVRGAMGQPVSMVPLVIHVTNGAEEHEHRCQVARVPALFSSLVATAAASCLDGEGKAPLELTLQMRSRVEVEGREAFEVEDTYSGEKYQGPPGLLTAMTPLSQQLDKMVRNNYSSMQISAVECWVERPVGRKSARMVKARIPRKEYLAGETVTVEVDLEPYRAPQELANDPASGVRRTLSLTLPKTTEAGDYRLTLSNGPDDFQHDLRNHRWIGDPRSLNEVDRSLRASSTRRHTDLVARIETRGVGVGIGAVSLADLPTGVAEIIASNRRVDSERIPSAIVATDRTPWSLEGSLNVPFRVVEKRSSLSALDKPAAEKGGP